MLRFPRAAGVLCHVTSLPGPAGSGDLGESAYRFVDWLASARQGIWQMLPLGPPGYGESPYQCDSAFAGNPLVIGLDRLVDQKLLSRDEIEWPALPSPERVDFATVRPFREQRLERAFDRFQQQASTVERTAFTDFCRAHHYWLGDYALFAALKKAHDRRAWTEWEPELVRRDPAALALWSEKLVREIEREKFVQYQFDRQWYELKGCANSHGIRLMGDVPIFIAHDSADVWARPDLFSLDSSGHPTVIAGVPPDYFSETGQRWGNPLYRWNERHDGVFDWWVSRMRRAMHQFDLVRLDHFRGFEAYWEIPAQDETAAGGRWVAGPGADLFLHLSAQLGELPLVAEDLGVITPAVDALRDDLGFPGMRVLQFAFGDDPKSIDYQPHNYPRHCVVYTGTHDNDTTVGWFQSGAGDGTTRNSEQVARERATVLRYLGTDGGNVHWDLIRLALGSVADTAIVPLQDVLGLPSSARMNLPGTLQGNWCWRCAPGAMIEDLARRLAEMTTVYGRAAAENRS